MGPELTELRDALAKAFPSTAQALQIADEAELPRQTIRDTLDPQATWSAVLTLAERHGKLPMLIERLRLSYGGDVALDAALTRYERAARAAPPRAIGSHPLRGFMGRAWLRVLSACLLIPLGYSAVQIWLHKKEFQSAPALLRSVHSWVVIGCLLLFLLLRVRRLGLLVTRVILGPPEPPAPIGSRLFRGLMAYGEPDRHEFPGREAETKECTQRIAEWPFFILEGETGCGKTSILNAALIPLHHAHGRVVSCRIAQDPIGRLHAALRDQPLPAPGSISLPELRGALLDAPGSGDQPMLLCIDQFEELFVTVNSAERREQFMALLRDAIGAGKFRLILATRSDFLDLLLRLCRTVDADQRILNLGNYYTLEAFPKDQAIAVIKEILTPLSAGDALREQQLARFGEALVGELLRPPRDPRLVRDNRPTVLPVELQTIGLLLERRGLENLSAERLATLGGKVGVMRLFLEDAKDYVLRKTGVSGDATLLILSELISPAGTKWPRSIKAIQERLGSRLLAAVRVEQVMSALAEQRLVKQLPAEEGDDSLRYELLHEYLVHVLAQVPDPVLRKAADARERLQFWTRRAQASDAAPPRGMLGRAGSLFDQPMPLWEALALGRYAAAGPESQVVKRSLRVFGVRVATTLICAGILLGGGLVAWMQTWHYERWAILRSKPGHGAGYESSATVPPLVSWTYALAYSGDRKAAVDLAISQTNDAQRLLSQGYYSLGLRRAGEAREASALLRDVLSKLDEAQWRSDVRAHWKRVLRQSAALVSNPDEVTEFVTALGTIRVAQIRASAVLAAVEGATSHELAVACLQAATQMLEKGPRDDLAKDTLTAIAKAEKQHDFGGLKSSAIKAAVQAVLAGPSESRSTASLASLLATLGQFETAWSVLEQRSALFDSNERLSEAGQEVLNKAIERREISWLPPVLSKEKGRRVVSVYMAMAYSMANHDDLASALQCIEKIKNETIYFGNYLKSLVVIVNKLIQSGKVPLSIEQPQGSQRALWVAIGEALPNRLIGQFSSIDYDQEEIISLTSVILNENIVKEDAWAHKALRYVSTSLLQHGKYQSVLELMKVAIQFAVERKSLRAKQLIGAWLNEAEMELEGHDPLDIRYILRLAKVRYSLKSGYLDLAEQELGEILVLLSEPQEKHSLLKTRLFGAARRQFIDVAYAILVHKGRESTLLEHSQRALSSIPCEFREKLALRLLAENKEEAALRVAAKCATSCLGIMAHHLALRRRMTEAIRFTQACPRDAPSDYPLDVALLGVDADELTAAQAHLAREDVDSVSKERLRAELAKYHARHGRFTEARRLAETCSEMKIRLGAFASIFTEMSRRQNPALDSLLKKEAASTRESALKETPKEPIESEE